VALADRFVLKTRKAASGCIEWTAARLPNGYGKIKRQSYLLDGAHRVSYELFVGVIPDGLFVLHRCDNRLCVNPSHLFIGTQKDNIDDMVSKGRHRPSGVQGEEHPSAKLTRRAVLSIRAKHRAGEATASLAKKHHVSTTLVWRIVTRQTWRSVP
jgi:hypothetical protein